jgi:hypothetical protein
MGRAHLGTLAEIPPIEVESGETGRQVILRVGAYRLTSKEQLEPPFSEVVRKIESSLAEDSRVKDARAPEFVQDAWCHRPYIYPAGADRDDLLTGADVLRGLVLDDYFAFTVEVPEKNQRKVDENDQLPTRYAAWWDGQLLGVAWEGDPSAPVTKSGGHVVRDILEKTMERVDLGLYVQSCSAGCKHDFTHTDVRISMELSGESSTKFEPGPYVKEVVARTPGSCVDGWEAAEVVFQAVLRGFDEFADMKNTGRRILEIEESARVDVNSLLAINMGRAEIATLGRFDRVKAEFESRGWRKQSRELIARIWLAVTNLEMLRRDWDEVQGNFRRRVAETSRSLLYELDYAGEVDQVGALDTDTMRAAVEEAASRLDNRALLWGTAFAGLVGGLAGAIGGIIAG